jgi:hypothetical protein
MAREEGHEPHDIPVDAPEADVLEQERSWGDEEPVVEPGAEVPIDAPEGDVLDQQRDATPDDEERP